MLELAAIFITLTTLLTYLNYRFIRLPPTIGVMVTALLFSVLLQVLSWMEHPLLENEMQEIISQLDFSDLLMTWFLPALLFAGALHVDLRDLKSYRWPIGLLATVGVLISTFVVAGLTFYICQWFDWSIPFIYCLIFGALISPTDPIAVMGILSSAGAPKPLATTIVGESLFNDGMAVVLFSLLLGIIVSGESPTVGGVSALFAKEALGGIAFGCLLGFGVYLLLRRVDQYQIEVMLTLATVLGGAALASRLHVSAPIALVVAGLIIGNFGRAYAMSEETRRYVDKFWELIDEILNALLFALIGLELLLIPFSWLHVGAGLVVGAAVVCARYFTIAPGVVLFRKICKDKVDIPAGSARILTWGGLRGAVSVALALALPAGEVRDVLLNLTYIIVLVSILLQGLTIGPMVRRLFPSSNNPE